MKLEIIDFNKIFDPEKVITSSTMLEKTREKKKEKKFDENSIFSERIYGDPEDPDNIDILGWIDFGEGEVINPIAFFRLKKLFKKENLNKIISFNKETNSEGEFIEEPIEDANLGLIEFKNRFLEMFEKYANKSKPEYKVIKDMYDNGTLFISKFPVFNPRIRPAVLLHNTLIYDDINKYYNLIIKYNNEISNLRLEETDKEDGILSKLEILYQIQFNCNKVVEAIIESFLKGKRGLFRRIMIGARLNFSSRLLIVPKPDGSLDSIDIPYVAFLELYKYFLVNLIYSTENISPNEALQRIEDAKNYFDPKIYKYMLELKDKTNLGCQFLIDRNPTINIGSIILVKLDKIKTDYNDLTMSLSNNVLACLGADFDGDVLNLIPIFTTDQKKAFENFKPSKLIISKNDGKFNRDFQFDKDQKLGLWNLVNN